MQLGISGFSSQPSLDLQASLVNDRGDLLREIRPLQGVSQIDVDLPQGIFYLHVEGLGRGDPAQDGYSDYGSLGLYRITGSANIVDLPNESPVPIINSSTATGYAPLSVSFSSNGSYDPDGSIARYLWDFGDGNVSNQANANHVYQHPGTYNVQLTIEDDQGAVSIARTSVEILEAPPVKRIDLAELSASIQSQKGGSFLVIRILVMDSDGRPVAGSPVVVSLSGVIRGTLSGQTGPDGYLIVSSSKIRKSGDVQIIVNLGIQDGIQVDESLYSVSSELNLRIL